jgi:hypothetical protein
VRGAAAARAFITDRAPEGTSDRVMFWYVSFACRNVERGMPRSVTARPLTVTVPLPEDEFNLMRQAAANTGNTVELLSWTTYADHHLHAAW